MSQPHAHGPLGRYAQTEESRRAAIASAPSIDGLLRRILGLFQPHRTPLMITISLVITGAALSVVPPLLIQDAFNEGLFPEGGIPNLGLLSTLVGIMVGLWVVIGALSVWQHYLTAQIGNRVMGSLRDACSNTSNPCTLVSSPRQRPGRFNPDFKTMSEVWRVFSKKSSPIS